jgi:hypothetical protein
MLDQLASEARTALTDPAGLMEEPEDLVLYAVERLDTIIGTLNPSDWNAVTTADALTALGRQLAEVKDGIEASANFRGWLAALVELDGALDHLDVAIAELKPS